MGEGDTGYSLAPTIVTVCSSNNLFSDSNYFEVALDISCLNHKCFESKISCYCCNLTMTFHRSFDLDSVNGSSFANYFHLCYYSDLNTLKSLCSAFYLRLKKEYFIKSANSPTQIELNLNLPCCNEEGIPHQF